MALPAGTRLIGELDTVTGEFHGHVDQFETFGSEIRQAFQQPRSFEESLQWKCQEQSVPKISTLRNCIQCLAIIMYTPTNE